MHECSTQFETRGVEVVLSRAWSHVFTHPQGDDLKMYLVFVPVERVLRGLRIIRLDLKIRMLRISTIGEVDNIPRESHLSVVST